MTSPRQQVPGDVPALVGQQTLQRNSTTQSSTVPAPSGTAVVRAGKSTSNSSSLPALTGSGLATSVLLANQHISAAGIIPAPVGTAVVHIGRSTSGTATLPSPQAWAVASHRTVRAFQTPAYKERFEFRGSRMPGFFLQSMSVWRLAGAWDYGPVTDPAHIGNPERFLRGGHIHYLSPTDEAELTAAGLGDHFYDEVRR